MGNKIKTKYKIWASSFIPYAKTPPILLDLPGFKGVLVVDGDNRGFGHAGGNARMWHLFYLDLERNYPLVGVAQQGTNYAKTQLKSSTGYIAGKPRQEASDTKGVIYPQNIQIQTKKGPSPPPPKVSKQGNVITVKIKGSAQTQLLPKLVAPIIAYEFDLFFDLDNKKLTYSGKWRRWLFPAYELNVSSFGNVLYDSPTFNPMDTPLNPLEFAKLGDSTIYRSGARDLTNEQEGMPQY
jgi:hypothetical protein